MSYVLESSEYPHSEKMIVIAREKTSPSALPMIMLSKTKVNNADAAVQHSCCRSAVPWSHKLSDNRWFLLLPQACPLSWFPPSTRASPFIN
jgi:hypothetical protein